MFDRSQALVQPRQSIFKQLKLRRLKPKYRCHYPSGAAIGFATFFLSTSISIAGILLNPAATLARGLQIVGGSFTDTSTFGGFITLHPTTNQLSYWYIRTQPNQGIAGALYAPGSGDTGKIEKLSSDRLKLIFHDSDTTQTLVLIVSIENGATLADFKGGSLTGVSNAETFETSSLNNSGEGITREVAGNRDRRAFNGANLIEVEY
jgi:hypothetical protein